MTEDKTWGSWFKMLSENQALVITGMIHKWALLTERDGIRLGKKSN
jgi:hypothetical protein